MNQGKIDRKYVLCEDGFQNVEKGGKIVGFQLKMRIPDYRGLPLALLGGLKISVDGREFPDGSLSVTSEGETFSLSEIENVTSIYWLCEEPITVTVSGEGLPAGKHHVEAYAALRISYMPAARFEGNALDLEIK